jgi:hypothetical protein
MNDDEMATANLLIRKGTTTETRLSGGNYYCG